MNKCLGILGGGQLGLYLCQAAQKQDVDTVVLSEVGEPPAAVAAGKVLNFDLDNLDAVGEMIRDCDVITFEMEAIPDASLELLKQAEAAGEIKVRPAVETLSLIKDKGLQKTWLDAQDIPTAPFLLFDGEAPDLSAWHRQLGARLVQKARRGGYDGMGVQVLDADVTNDQIWGIPSVIESFLPDCQEVAVIVARAESGATAVYPPVGMEFAHGLNALSLVFAPAGLPEDTAARAKQLSIDAVTALDGVGLFAIELFITADDEILVNEISPRVHNSGHLTMDAGTASQYEQHVRAVMGEEVIEVDHPTSAAMVNILYEEPLRPVCPPAPVRQLGTSDGVFIYWYGKSPGREGRKMGHITATGINTDDAANKARAALKELAEQAARCAA